MEVLTHSLLTDMEVEWTVTDSNDSGDCETKPKRKRQRLDHLSNEEKLMRRLSECKTKIDLVKLKNRMAAQSARDRKKVKMQDLEHEVVVLTQQRNVLLNQNESLKHKNALLEQQNRELKQRLSELEKGSVKVEYMPSEEPTETFESAELISEPQQKDQVSSPVILMASLTTQLAFWLILQNLMLCSMFSLSIQKNCSIRDKALKAYNCRLEMSLNAEQDFLSQKRHHIWDQLKT